VKQGIIAVCGAHSGCGKTAVAEKLVRFFGPSWGAVKYSKTAFYTSITEAASHDLSSHKDTARLHRAGAAKVIWIQSPREELEESLNIALNMLSAYEGIIIEGNAPIEFIQPDIVIFVFGKDSKRLKSSAAHTLKKANIILYQDQPPGSELLPRTMTGKEPVDCLHLPNPEDCGMLLEEVMKKLTKGTAKSSTPLKTRENHREGMEDFQKEETTTLREKLLTMAHERSISCALARSIAEDEGLSFNEVGRIADELKIKIINCQLGCF
jgi:LAO/AO transport system kinase